jgi:hypothetical protein
MKSLLKTVIPAGAVIWTYFILIASKALEFSAFHGSPIRPFHVYAVLIAASAATLAINRPRVTKAELATLANFAALCFMMVASLGGSESFSFGLALWPIANLLMAIAMFSFCRRGLDITAAVQAALVIQLAAIFIDMWFPATFAEWAGRPAGLPQNANNGALLVAFLLALLLPARLGLAPSRAMLYGVIASAPLVLVTLSKSGVLFYLVVLAAFAVSQWFAPTIVKPRAIFLAGFTSVVILTACLAPTLHEPWAIALWRDRIGISAPDILPAPINAAAARLADELRVSKPPEVLTQDKVIEATSSEAPVTQEALSESMKAADVTTDLRLNAARSFLQDGLQHPIVGLGTGYTIQFKTGPHNTFILLFVEQGVFAVMLFFMMMAVLTGIAINRRSPMLLALTVIGWGDAMLSHTMLIEPWFIVFAGAALGMTSPQKPGPVVTPGALIV